ncbi:hypothetical protein CCACVL1_16174, partial [Corchorus capsularis]
FVAKPRTPPRRHRSGAPMDPFQVNSI